MYSCLFLLCMVKGNSLFSAVSAAPTWPFEQQQQGIQGGTGGGTGGGGGQPFSPQMQPFQRWAFLNRNKRQVGDVEIENWMIVYKSNEYCISIVVSYHFNLGRKGHRRARLYG